MSDRKPEQNSPTGHPQSVPAVPSAAQQRRRSEDLFGSSKEMVILHDGEEYRLRITKNNKLILTK